ncbi:hypothetical protein CEXT_602701 [Caerostris extrusa]|uniref:Secreted protein n=1 Tax=Caerostris extrusa TaxID=172846 RepID=A0AAV4Y6M6_CAEEX|nr:hypothetical protein CEXT_602701 [Caerostris extrusa]
MNSRIVSGALILTFILEFRVRDPLMVHVIIEIKKFYKFLSDFSTKGRSRNKKSSKKQKKKKKRIDSQFQFASTNKFILCGYLCPITLKTANCLPPDRGLDLRQKDIGSSSVLLHPV